HPIIEGHEQIILLQIAVEFDGEDGALEGEFLIGIHTELVGIADDGRHFGEGRVGEINGEFDSYGQYPVRSGQSWCQLLVLSPTLRAPTRPVNHLRAKIRELPEQPHTIHLRERERVPGLPTNAVVGGPQVDTDLATGEVTTPGGPRLNPGPRRPPPPPVDSCGWP